MGERQTFYFPEGDIQMANKHKKWCLTSSPMCQIPIKAPVKLLTQLSQRLKGKIVPTPNVDGIAETQDCLCIAGGK